MNTKKYNRTNILHTETKLLSITNDAFCEKSQTPFISVETQAEIVWI